MVINDILEASFRHRLACIDAPLSLLCELQVLLVNNLHLDPQLILFLPKAEGGQGLIHLQRTAVAFCLQFVQRLLAETSDAAWRSASCELRTYGGLDMCLFLMELCDAFITGFPPFYRNLLRELTLFRVKKDSEITLYWLLQEPL